MVGDRDSSQCIGGIVSGSHSPQIVVVEGVKSSRSYVIILCGGDQERKRKRDRGEKGRGSEREEREGEGGREGRGREEEWRGRREGRGREGE